MKTSKILSQVRAILLFFIIALFLSGLTAIPVITELSLVLSFISEDSQLYGWLNNILSAYKDADTRYPFLLYGYDWLAFAHFILAILFIGPYRDPVKNIWVIEFGLIACVLVVPFAFIAGYFRGIPVWWRLIDCSFGLIGFLPLWACHIKTNQLITNKHSSFN